MADIYQIVMVDLDLTNKGGRYFRFCTAMHDCVYNGNTYSAVGNLLNIDSIEETSDLTTIGTVVTLTGIDPAYRKEINDNTFLRAPIDILVGQVTEGTNTITNVGYWHRGTCDTPNTVIDYNTEPNELTIEVSTQSVFGNLDKVPDLCRASQASHSTRHPGDEFFSFVGAITNEETWRTN